MQSDLLDLKNLGNTSVNWLHTIGINSREELLNTGPVAAYLEIKHRGIRVSKVLLYALYGALNDTPWNDLDSATKQGLVEEALKQQHRHCIHSS
jgi:DNA transformation protein